MFCDSLSLPTTVVLDISLFCPRMFCCDVVFQDLSKCHTGLGILDLLQFLFTRFPTSSNNSLASLEYLEYLIRSLWTWKCPSIEIYQIQQYSPLAAKIDTKQHQYLLPFNGNGALKNNWNFLIEAKTTKWQILFSGQPVGASPVGCR